MTWLNSLPPKSLSGWHQIRAAFLDNYYTKSKTAFLKARLANFQQNSGESFSDAWNRFKSYRRDCPHHGYTESQMLSIFYDGVDWEHKSALNTASRGNFMTQSVDGAKELIENLAESYRDKSLEYDFSTRVNSVRDDKISELCELLKLLIKGKGVCFAGTDAIQGRREEDVAYVGDGFSDGQEYSNSKPHHDRPLSEPNASSSSRFDANATKSMFEQLLQGQEKLTGSFNERLDHVYADFNSKFSGMSQMVEQVAAHQNAMEVKLAQTAEAVQRQEAVRADSSPKKFANTISLSSPEAEVDMLEALLKGDIEEIECKWVEESINPAEVQIGVTRHPPEDIPSASNSSSVSRSQHATQPKHVSKPQPQFLNRAKSEKEKEKEFEAKRQDILRQVIKESPSHSFIRNSPVIKSFIKQLSTSNVSVEDGVQTVLKEVNAMGISLMKIAKPTPPVRKQLKTLEKLESPGRFVFNCSINDMAMKDALCDTGATVNVMSQRIARRLGLQFHPVAMTPIILADCSSVHANGFVADVNLQIGECLVPVDFHIMDINEAINSPLILGSSFLATVGAVMDFPNRRVSFSKIDKDVYYHLDPPGGTSCKIVLQNIRKNSAHEVVPKAAQTVTNEAAKADTPSLAEIKDSSSSFAQLSLVIPKELQNMSDDVIKDKMRNTIALFPRVSHWQVRDEVLVAKRHAMNRVFKPP